MRRRIFVAVPISRQLQRQILEWEQQWQQLPVRWLRGKNLHVTLVPPWYTEDVERIIVQLQATKGTFAAAKVPFVITFTHVTYGPDPRHPRLIWADGEAPRALEQLKEKTEAALRMKPERRAFRLHLTIARFRPETFSSFPVKTLHERVVWRDTVSSFLLMESHLSSAGADYEILATFPV